MSYMPLPDFRKDVQFMARKVRKDTKSRVLHKGECYRREKDLYSYSYTDPLGKRHSVYAQDLGKLREKEKRITQASVAFQ